MIDPKKLQAFASMPPMPLNLAPPGLAEGEAEQIEEALKDDMSDESQTLRKLRHSVGYMELNEPAGAFSCGTCRFATTEGFCGHIDVRAYVSPDNGCCNQFWPATAQVTFPPGAKAPQDMSSFPTAAR